MQSETAAYLHPVQLQFVAVRELFIKTYRHLPHDFILADSDVHMESVFTGYMAETKTLQINAGVHTGENRDLTEEEEKRLVRENGLSLRMRVKVVGQYSVDETRFPLDLLDEWAKKGGAMTLFPYVREQVYALTARCGIRPVILPVMQLPTIKISPTLESQGVLAGISDPYARI